MELNLNSEHIGNDRIKISWNDATRRDFEEGAKDNFAYLAVAFFVGSILIYLYFGMVEKTLPIGWGALFLLGSIFGLIKILDIPTWSFPKENAVIVDKFGIEHNGQMLTYDRVSRIEYGEKKLWSSVPYGTFNYTEIRVWFADKRFYVLSRNSWETQINHEIKATIDEVVAFMKKVDQTNDQHAADTEKPSSKTGGNKFGMPDY